jgi:hypothetical protein
MDLYVTNCVYFSYVYISQILLCWSENLITVFRVNLISKGHELNEISYQLYMLLIAVCYLLSVFSVEMKF